MARSPYESYKKNIAQFRKERRPLQSVGAQLERTRKKIKEEERKNRERLKLIGQVTQLGRNVARNVEDVGDIRRGKELLGIEEDRSFAGKLRDYLLGPSPSRRLWKEGREISAGSVGTIGRLEERFPEMAQPIVQQARDYMTDPRINRTIESFSPKFDKPYNVSESVQNMAQSYLHNDLFKE